MSHNTFIHRIVAPLLRPLLGTGIRPNHVTAVRLIAGISAAWAYADHGILLAGLIFTLGCVLDRADGVLARLAGLTSHHGHLFDLASDCVSTVAVFVGLSWSLLGPLRTCAPLLAICSSGGILVLFWQLNRPRTSQRRQADRAFDPDDAIFLLPFGVWFFGPGPVLLVGAIATPLAALGVSVPWSMLFDRMRGRASATVKLPSDRSGVAAATSPRQDEAAGP